MEKINILIAIFNLIGFISLGIEYYRTKTIDMIIFCPKCKLKHIDEPEPNWCKCGHKSFMHEPRGDRGRDVCEDYGCLCKEFKCRWTNPPHKKHLCKPQDGGCGLIFKTSNRNTNGVQSL